MDAKNLLERLRAGEDADHEDGATTEGEVDEAFQQIMFSDRIVINKARKCCASRPDKDNLKSDTNIFIPLNSIISHTLPRVSRCCCTFFLFRFFFLLFFSSVFCFCFCSLLSHFLCC